MIKTCAYCKYTRGDSKVSQTHVALSFIVTHTSCTIIVKLTENDVMVCANPPRVLPRPAEPSTKMTAGMQIKKTLLKIWHNAVHLSFFLIFLTLRKMYDIIKPFSF